jgi:hypothetical protein
VLGVGESRVSQIHSVAVARLRATLSNARQSQRRAAALPSLSRNDEVQT